MGSFEGKTAVVLGASAEGGSGWMTAELFAARGANVVVGARRLEGVEKLAAKTGGFGVRCDAGVEAEVEAMAEAAVERYGGIDMAVLAAGTPFVGMIDQLSDDDIYNALRINYVGALYFIRHMARRMKAGGAITVVTSLSITRPVPGYGNYACAKSAARTLCEYAALEYAPRQIRVNNIVAGLIASPMTAALREMPEAWGVFLKEVPLGRAVQPAEIGAAALWLCSPEAAVTGVSLEVDNGNHLLRSPQPNEIPSGSIEENARAGGY